MKSNTNKKNINNFKKTSFGFDNLAICKSFYVAEKFLVLFIIISLLLNLQGKYYGSLSFNSISLF